MSIKKILLLASMALATAAFAIPASASAAKATITDNGIIKTSQELHFVSANFKFEALGSGMECEATMKITVKEDINEVTNFTINTPTCLFFGNPYKNCKFEPTEGDTVTKLPWVVDPEITGSKDLLTLTGNTAGEEARIDGKTEKASTTACFTTQNDILLKHDPANGFGVTMEVTTVNGFIDGATWTGNVKVVNSLGSSSTAAKGTFTITPSETSTYTMSLTP